MFTNFIVPVEVKEISNLITAIKDLGVAGWKFTEEPGRYTCTFLVPNVKE